MKTNDEFTNQYQPIIKYLMLGNHAKEIGVLLNILVFTVQTHLRDIYKIYRVRCQVELVIYAIKNGFFIDLGTMLVYYNDEVI